MKILVVDVGGNNIKLLASGQRIARKVPSGPSLTARRMVSAVKKATRDWRYDAVTRWRRLVAEIVPRLHEAFQVEDVVLGGGNAKHLKELPPGARLGNNTRAFVGGFRLWESRNGLGRQGSRPAGAARCA